MGSRWIPRITSPGTGGGPPPPSAGGDGFLWNANGDLATYPEQAASFNGLLQNNVLLAGPGPYDGQRLVETAATISALVAIQRGPSVAPSSTTIEFYRIRGAFPGTVTSLGTVTVSNVQQFQLATAAPVVNDLAVGDIVFVSFASAPDPDASDVTAFLEFV